MSTLSFSLFFVNSFFAVNSFCGCKILSYQFYIYSAHAKFGFLKFYSSFSNATELRGDEVDKGVDGYVHRTLYDNISKETYKGFSNFDFNISMFVRLKYLLNNKPLNNDTQKEIEGLMFSQFQSLLSDRKPPVVLGVSVDNLSSKLVDFCHQSVDGLKRYLVKMTAKCKEFNLCHDVNSLVKESDVLE